MKSMVDGGHIIRLIRGLARLGLVWLVFALIAGLGLARLRGLARPALAFEIGFRASTSPLASFGPSGPISATYRRGFWQGAVGWPMPD